MSRQVAQKNRGAFQYPDKNHRLARKVSGDLCAHFGDALVPVRLQVGAGLNHGLQQAYDLARAFGSATPCMNLRCWEENALARLAPIVELGRSRAHKANLGTYIPVQPGRTAAPLGDQWGDPEWVNA